MSSRKRPVTSVRRAGNALARGLAFVALIVASACSHSSSSSERKPDVILLVVDTLRSDRLSCYGYPRKTSPAIDAIASEGALFEDVTSQAPWTLPSMSSMLSGKYLTEHRDYPPRSDVLIAETFKKAGYRTLGLSANTLLTKENGFDRGYDYYDAEQDPTVAAGDARAFDRVREVLAAPLDRALAVDAQGHRAPLFLYVQVMDPHFPYHEHAEFAAELPIDRAEPVQPAGWQAQMLEGRSAPPPENDPGWSGELARLQLERGRYDQEVRFVDENLKGLLADLKTRGVGDEAVLAIVADHGEGLWEHVNVATPEELKKHGPDGFFFQGHGYHLFEEAIRTPFILRGKGVPKGKRFAQPVENVDLYPTLCALAGIEPPHGLDGRNLVELMRGEAKNWRELSYSFVVLAACVREASSGLKLIAPTGFGAAKGVAAELYAVPQDIDERNNLLAESTPGHYLSQARRLGAHLEEIVRSHPTKTTWGETKSAQQSKNLKGLGYTGGFTEGRAGEGQPKPDARLRLP